MRATGRTTSPSSCARCPTRPCPGHASLPAPMPRAHPSSRRPTPPHLTLWEGDRLVAAAPGYLKDNSHGEFVFDHAWAHAYSRYGQDYFPKFLCAVPYSPVTGPRLLARDDAARRSLVEAIIATTREAGLSSAHVNFHPEDEDAAFGPGWLPRTDLQYHWHNDRAWQDFADLLAAKNHTRSE